VNMVQKLYTKWRKVSPEMGRDKGKWWRRWIQVWYIWYIVRTFVNATVYPYPAQNNLKRKSPSASPQYISLQGTFHIQA
jgi:hypothetical protein